MNLAIGNAFHELTTINSTNLYAMEQFHAGMANHGAVFFAHNQETGRGQRGKEWWSLPGQNIAMSILLDTSKLSISQRFRLSATMSIGVLDWLKQLVPGPWKIKWPNDIYFNDRKAGGILIENILQGGKWRMAIAGIGINMNQHAFPDYLPNPVSLYLIDGKRYDCVSEAKNLCGYLENRWQQLMRYEWNAILTDYNEHLFGRGAICKIKKENAVMPCLIQKVDEQGHLIAGDNGELSFEFGTVSWIL